MQMQSLRSDSLYISPSKAFSKSSADHVVGAALNGAASLIPSRLAIL